MRDSRRVYTFGGSELEPAEYELYVNCPWCGQWHSVDDDICPAWPVAPGEDRITELDMDGAA